MAVYSYTGRQLSRKVEPKKTFWTARKIVVTSSLSLLPLLITAVVLKVPTPSESIKRYDPAVYVNPAPKQEEISAETRQQLEEHFRLSQLNSDRAAQAAWDRSYVEARKDACERRKVSSELC